MTKTLTLTLEGGHVDDIRRMTGLEDPEWIKMSFAVYWLLLSENPDNVVRFFRTNGQLAHMGLTPEAAETLQNGETT